MATRSTVSRARGKTAQVSLRDYEDDETVRQFEPISDSLKAQEEDVLGFAPVEVTPRYLSSLAAGLAWFQEVALGRNSAPEGRVMTKLPQKIFSDFKPKGALEILLATCLRFKETHGLRRLDLKNLDKKRLYLDMLKMCEKNLKAKKAIPMYKIFFTHKLKPEKEEALRAMVNRRAVVVTNMRDASHIVYNDPEGCSIEETEGVEVEGGGGRDYCWTLAKRDKFSLVHWWYCPDSYNQWIPSTDVQGEPEPVEEHRGPWHVGARFVEDTDYFNEWMNETDYEIPPEDRDKLESPPVHAESDHHARERSSRKRKREHTSSGELEEALETVKARRIQSDSQKEEDKARERERARAKERRRERDRERNARKRRERERQRERRERDRARRRERELEKARRKKKEEEHEPEVQEKDIVAINEHARKRERERERRRLALGDAKSEDSRASALKIRLSLRGAEEVKVDGSKDRKKEKDKAKRKESKRATEKEEKEKEAPAKAKAPPVKRKSEDDTNLAVNKERSESAFEGTDSPEAVIKTKREDQMTRAGSSSDKPGTEDGNKGQEISEKDSQGAENRRATKDDIREEVKRKKSKRERRDRRDRERNKKKQPGVTFVESAIPLAENDVRRIRNLSMEGQDEINEVRTEGRPRDNLIRKESVQDGSRESGAKQDTSSARPGREIEGQEVMNGPEGSKKADIEELAQDGQKESRVKAVAVSALKGEEGGAPASVADLIDALPQAPVRIPAQARWFRLDSIHETEKRALSEFFSNKYPSKTPKVYKVYRDFMIHAWRNAPDKYLTATSVRRQLAGDVCAILRVHSFLEHWGLINYGVNPSLRPSAMPLARTHAWRTTPIAVSDVNSKATSVPRILLFDESTPQRRNAPPISLKQAMNNASKLPPGQVSLASRREVYAAAAATTYTCDSCGADCSKTRYHCIGAADMDLCAKCFADGKYPTMLGARDFEQLTTGLQTDDLENPTWSETEVLLLLEALEKYGDDWDAVTKHVGTKSRDACVLHFLRLPIEDSFLGDQLGKWGPKNGGNQFEGQLFPFADAGNPVMAQVAFLASSVGPEVAAAAAQAALSVLMGGEVSDEVKRERERLAGMLMNGHSAPGTVDEQSKGKIESNRKLQVDNTKGDSTSSRQAEGTTPMEGVQMANGAAPKADDSPSSAENVGKEKTVRPNEAQRKEAGPGPLDPTKRMNLPHDSTINGGHAASGSAHSKQLIPPEPRSGSRSGTTTDLDAAAVRASAAVALAAAAARARKLADAEAREIERLFAVILETKLRALEAKMKHFEDFENYVRAERETLERQRQQLYCERISVAMSKRTSGSVTGLETSRPDGFVHQGTRFDDAPYSLGPLKLPPTSSQVHRSGSVSFSSGTLKASVPLGVSSPSSNNVHSNAAGTPLTNSGNLSQSAVAINVVGSNRGGTNAALGVQHSGQLQTSQALGSGGNIQGLASQQGGRTNAMPNASGFPVGVMQRPVGPGNAVAGTTPNQTLSVEQKAQSLPP